MLTHLRTVDGIDYFFDPEVLLLAYGGHAIRLGPYGNIEVLIATTDSVEWTPISELDLVQPIGKPAKARKQ